MKKIVKLTERDLVKLIKKILKEGEDLTSQQSAKHWTRKIRNRITEQLIPVDKNDRVSRSRQICYKYTVQDGDNMWDIASKMRKKFEPNESMDNYWIGWTANMTEFNILNLNKIKTGDVIPVPNSCGKMNN